MASGFNQSRFNTAPFNGFRQICLSFLHSTAGTIGFLKAKWKVLLTNWFGIEW
jgi:hypothetical protein